MLRGHVNRRVIPEATKNHFVPLTVPDLSPINAAGPPEVLRTELARLRGILTAFEARLDGLGPIPDTQPYVASLLRDAHDRRRRALHAEIGRLEQQLQGASGSGGEEL